MAQSWNINNEELLKQWGERASVLRILHGKAAKKYSNYTFFITVPTIVLSATASFLQLRLENHCNEIHSELETFLACINLFIAILTGIGTIFNFHQKYEAHRSSSSNFGNFYRQVSCELSFPRNDREAPSETLRSMKRQYDNLLENAPDMPHVVVQDFKSHNKNLKISLPDICNGLDPIKICKSESFCQVHDSEIKIVVPSASTASHS